MIRTLWCTPLLVACTVNPTTNDTPLFPEASPEAAVILDFINDAEATLELLDGPVRLHRDAALTIVDHRNGADGVWGTADDRYFASVQEICDLPDVGSASIMRLLEYGWLHGWSEDFERGFEGVGFYPSEGRATLWLANGATDEELDHALHLDARAVAGILDARPIHSLPELAEVPWVGPATLQRLRDAGVSSLDD